MGVTVTSVLNQTLILKDAMRSNDLGSPPAGATGLVVAIGRDENSNVTRSLRFGGVHMTFVGFAYEGSNAVVSLFYLNDIEPAADNILLSYNPYDDFLMGAAWLTPDTDEEIYLVEGFYDNDTNTHTFTPSVDCAAVAYGEGTSGIAVYGSLTSMSTAIDGGDHFLFGKQEGLSASTEYTIGTTPTGAGACTVLCFASRTPLDLQTQVAVATFATTKDYTYALDIASTKPADAVGLLCAYWCYDATSYVQGDMTYGGLTMNRPARSYGTDAAIEFFYLDDLSGASGTTLGFQAGQYNIGGFSAVWLRAGTSVTFELNSNNTGADSTSITVDPGGTTVRTFIGVTSETISHGRGYMSGVVETAYLFAGNEQACLYISDEHSGSELFEGWVSTDPVVGAISFSAVGGGGGGGRPQALIFA